VEVNRSEGWQRANFIVKELISRGVPATLLVATSQGNSQLLPRRKKESVNNYRTRCRRVEVMKIWKG
jgi:outer membrane protein OmpA-like peptidoglycan-associated protein